MNRLFYLLLTVVVFVFGTTFAIKNGQSVDLNYYFGIAWHAPLSLMLLAAVVIGALIGYLIGLRRVFRVRRELAKARRQIRDVEEEVQNLRSLPIKDAI
jgi:putative membrane protein